MVVLLSTGELFLLGAKTFAGAHRLPGIDQLLLFPTQSAAHYRRTRSAFCSRLYTMPGSETLRALRLLSRSYGGLLSGSENVTVWPKF